MYRIQYKKAASKALKRMPAHIREKLYSRLHAIAAAPYIYQSDWKPMSGSPYWRLRVGGYRAICMIEDDALVLLVLKIGARGGVYK